MNKVQKIVELEVGEYYYRKYREVMFCPIGYWTPYDLISKSGRSSIEIKFEEKARSTFNLFFEHSCKGKQSGIVSTQASKWVHCIPLNLERISCLEFDVPTLKKELEAYELIKFCGDQSASTGKLLSIERAIEIATNKFEITIDWASWQPYWD